MNKKISLVLVIVFLVVFTGFFYFNLNFNDISEDKFYSQNFDSSKKKVLIYGSSHLIQLNSTHIKENVKKTSDEFIVFNMAENGDTPKRRSLNIEKDLGLNPEIVVYGVGFRDFSSNPKDNPNTDLRLVDLIPLDLTEVETLNPKLQTLELFRSIFIDLFSENKKENIPYPNTSIFSERVEDEIVEDKNLRKKISNEKNITIPTKNNEQEKYFRDIIETLDKNNVTTIIVLTPYHNIALESIPISEKQKFFEIISDIEKNYNVTIVDFTERFSNQSIWRDPTHIAYNKNALIFSDEFSKIIIEEIKK